MTNPKVKLESQHYNRNGVGGEAFYSVTFSLVEDGEVYGGLLAVVPNEDLVGYVAANLREAGVTTKQFESEFCDLADAAKDWDAHVYVLSPLTPERNWRGDRLAHPLCAALWKQVRSSYFPAVRS